MFEKLKNGYVAEEKFTLECLTRNIPISKRLYNTEPYDFVIEVNENLYRFKLKSHGKTKKDATWYV